MKRRYILAAFLFASLLISHPVSAAPLTPPIHITVLRADGSVLSGFDAASQNQAGGASLAVADLGTDGAPEIILGNGIGQEPRVRVFRIDGSEIGNFLAYAPNMGVGINVVACDLDGDGLSELITVPQRGAPAHVRVFSHQGDPIGDGVFAYPAHVRVGTNLACGDLNGDARDELVTLPSVGGGPHVKIWNMIDGELILQEEFFSGDASDTQGRVGLITDKSLMIANQQTAPAHLTTYQWDDDRRINMFSTVAYAALGITSMFAANNTLYLATTSPAMLVQANGETAIDIVSRFESVVGTAADIDHDGVQELFVVDAKPLYTTENAEKSIVVDLSEQRLYAYESGVLANTFLVSSARAPFTTPLGNHAVLAKLPLVDYTWTYGAGDPRNYSLGLVPYNLRIYPHIYIHYAYWHNNFGTPQSHGCINVNLENIKWIYEWADEGIPVTVRQ